jgi:DNA-binding SARP family transcriptional activator/tetratricopeptide (TPR) repeat protein
MPAQAGDAGPSFRLTCLGPVAFVSPAGAKVGFRTRKQAALLLFLARRPGEPILKDQLLDLLWSEDDEASARHSLSQSVSLLNKALGCVAVTAPAKDQLSLEKNQVWLDVTAFEAHVAAQRRAEARELWRGNLFDGFRIPRAPNFEHWAELERERLARLMREVLRDAADAERAAGNWTAMRHTAEALLVLDGLDEGAMLGYLEALVLLGDRTLALRRFREFEVLLRSEFDADPGHALRGWAQRQRRGETYAAVSAERAPAAPALVREVPVLPAAQPVFGRHEEFQTLWQAWEAARTGGGSFVLLRGPAGIGKSALAGKLANQVHVAGGQVAIVRCFRSEKSVPFAPISALVRQLARLPGFVALNPLWIGELSRLVPELRERFPGIPQPMAIDDSARYRLCDAALRAAECVADEQPLLFVVDDIQDADEATLALLHYFGRQVSSQSTLLLGIARSPAGDPDFERAFVDTARTAGFVHLLALGSLPDEEIRRIVQQVLAQRSFRAPLRTLALVADAARGNPLHAIELALALPGDEERPAEEWLAGLEAGTGGGVESFEHTAAERLAQLPAHAHAVAGALALAGRPLSDYDLAAVTALPTSSLASAIFALEAAQFIRRSGATLAFAHERYRESADAAVPDAERRAIHRALAQFLAKSAAGNPAARYEVAFHYAGARRPREARSNALAAARYAASIGAVRERAAGLELARRVTDGYDGRIAADLGKCFLDLKEFERLDALCTEAREEVRLAPGLAEEFRFLEIAADQHSGRAPLLGVQAALEELLASSGPAFARLADARNLLMRTADKTGDHRVVRRVARELRHGDSGMAKPRRSAHSLFASAYVLAKYYWPDRALPLLEEASGLAQAEQDWELEHLCRNGMGAVAKQLGRYEDSLDYYGIALALDRKTLDPLAEATSLVNIAVSEMALGQFEAAVEHLLMSAEIDEKFPRWPFRVYRFHNHGVVQLLMGEIDRAQTEFVRARDLSVEMNLWPIAVLALAGNALCAQRRLDYPLLRELSANLKAALSGRPRVLHDRWMVEAAFAWNRAINAGDVAGTLADLEGVIPELRRRDVDGWLRLELETIRLREEAQGSRLQIHRNRLVSLAEQYSALAIASDAQR